MEEEEDSIGATVPEAEMVSPEEDSGFEEELEEEDGAEEMTA